ncbi:MAG: hypothetical protein GX653_09060 [Clostridiales bacterium]|nr:hypothetical protein [Clostridiales bacterium]
MSNNTDKSTWLDALLGPDAREEQRPARFTRRRAADKPRDSTRASMRRDECRRCGSIMAIGGACPGCGALWDDMQ